MHYIYIALFYKLCNDSEKRVNTCTSVKETHLELRTEANLLKLTNANVLICTSSHQVSDCSIHVCVGVCLLGFSGCLFI